MLYLPVQSLCLLATGSDIIITHQSVGHTLNLPVQSLRPLATGSVFEGLHGKTDMLDTCDVQSNMKKSTRDSVVF